MPINDGHCTQPKFLPSKISTSEYCLKASLYLSLAAMASSRRNSTKASSQAPIKLTSNPQGMNNARNLGGISPNPRSPTETDSDSDTPLFTKRRRTQQECGMEDDELMFTGPVDREHISTPKKLSSSKPTITRREHTRGVARRVTPSKNKSTRPPRSALPTTKAPRSSKWDIPSSPEIADTTSQKLDPRPEPIIAPNGATSGSAPQSHEPLGVGPHLTVPQPTASRAKNVRIRRRPVYDDAHGLFLRTHSTALAFRPASNSIQPTRTLKNTLSARLNNAPTSRSRRLNPLATPFPMPTAQTIKFAQQVQSSELPTTNATTHNRIPLLTSASGPSPLQRCFYEAYRLPADLQHLYQPMPSPSSHLGSRRTPASPPLPSPKANGGSQLNQSSQLQSSGTPTKSKDNGN